MAQDLEFYLGGKWSAGTGDAHHELVSPVTGEHIANVPIPSQQDVDEAVAAAREAQDDYRHWSALERAELCHRVAEAVAARVPEVARIQTLEQGKPYHAESYDDITEANEYFCNAAEDVNQAFAIQKYISLVGLMIFAFGVGFLLPVLMVFLQLVGVATPRSLLRGWRYAIVGIFCLAAVITPSGDPVTLMMLAVPMIVLYFLAVLIGWFFLRRRRTAG